MEEMISVIVPAYNVEKYLKKCVDSILNQTYKNFEILIIDDGSTDGTSNVCEKLSSYDSRIRVFHKENGGLSDARNYGLERIYGEYITFIDSDDYVCEKYLEQLHLMICNKNVDIAIAGLQTFFDGDVPDCNVAGMYEIVSNEEATRRILKREGITQCSCGKLYRKKVWEEIRFPVGLLYEDYLTTFFVLAKASNVAISNDKLYFYLQRRESIMHYACNEKTVKLVDATQVVTPFVISTWPNLKDEALDLQVASCLKCMQQILNYNPDKFTDVQREIHKIVLDNAFRLIFSFKVSVKDKIKIICFLFGHKLFLNVYNRFDGTARL